MADKTSFKIGFRWISREVRDGSRVQVAELTRKKERQQFSRTDRIQLKLVRHLTLEGKPYTVHCLGPASRCDAEQSAFQFQRRIEVGHGKSWDWMRKQLITHADYLLYGTTHRADLAQRKPVGGKPATRAAR